MPVEKDIRGRDLVLAYGDHVVLSASDFEIPGGSLAALIGPNGSGKSTLLHAIAGLIEPVRGNLTVGGDRENGIAYVLQATRVNEAMPVTVQEVVAMGRYARLGPFRPFGASDREASRLAMERLGVLDLAAHHLDELSGGQRQRVFVAQGLVQDADILLLDEAVTGLDLVSRERILEAVLEEKERGRTVVMATHDLGDAAQADLVLLLAGRVVATGAPSEILTPDYLEEAYGVPVVGPEGSLMLDDPHHRPVSGRHRHFDRTGHAEHADQEPETPG